MQVYSHFQHFLIWVHFSGKLPHVLMSQSHWGLLQKLTAWQLSIYYISCSLWYIYSLISLSLHLTKHYWSPSHNWHNFLTSKIKVKTQTRFMLLFTSGSSLPWGNLQVLCLVSPPGIYLPSTPNNQLFMLLQRPYSDQIHILWWQRRQMG